METIGGRIKAVRIERGLTLADLAGQANLSIGYLSQIERDKTTPSLSALTTIAKGLGVTLRYFFEEANVELARVQRASLNHEQEEERPIEIARLTQETGTSKLEAFRVTLTSSAVTEPLETVPGEEFCHVLAGSLTIQVGDERHDLNVGDSIHYDALQPHQWSNQSDEACIFIWGRAPAAQASGGDWSSDQTRVRLADIADSPEPEG